MKVVARSASPISVMSTCRSDLKVATCRHGRALAGIKANEKQAVAIAKPRMSTRELTSNELLGLRAGLVVEAHGRSERPLRRQLDCGAFRGVGPALFDGLCGLGSWLSSVAPAPGAKRRSVRTEPESRQRAVPGSLLAAVSRRGFRRRQLPRRLHLGRRLSRGRLRRRHRRGRHGGRRRIVCAPSTRGGEGERAAGKKQYEERQRRPPSPERTPY